MYLVKETGIMDCLEVICGTSARLSSLLQIWDFESTNFADVTSDSGKFEMEPLNELLIGHNVCLTSVVKSPKPNSFVWFAQVRHVKSCLLKPSSDIRQ